MLGLRLQSSTLAVQAIGMMCQNLGTNRSLCVQINNLTNDYQLINPSNFYRSGYCTRPMELEILPHSMEGLAFKKPSGTACGAVGVFKYDISKYPGTYDDVLDHKCDLAIMYSVPFDRNAYSNWFAIDTQEKIDVNYQKYRNMYYDSEWESKRAVAGKLIEVSGCGFRVSGMMGEGANSIMIITLEDMDAKKAARLAAKSTPKSSSAQPSFASEKATIYTPQTIDEPGLTVTTFPAKEKASKFYIRKDKAPHG